MALPSSAPQNGHTGFGAGAFPLSIPPVAGRISPQPRRMEMPLNASRSVTRQRFGELVLEGFRPSIQMGQLTRWDRAPEGPAELGVIRTYDSRMKSPRSFDSADNARFVQLGLQGFQRMPLPAAEPSAPRG